MEWLFSHDNFRYGFLATYLAVLSVVCLYGFHRYLLVHLFYKYRRNTPRLDACFRELPKVTIQLPMYNEEAVARRVIDATCRIDYPRDRLEIQVLDDSTDETVEIARQAVAEWRGQGFDIRHLHRTQRTGYKAGALEAGLKTATGEFILIFDADFIPPADILQETIHYFTDSRVGMVQARWEHLNRDQSLLTRTQAILLDGHFVIEHSARNRSGRFMSFNGTAGLWRRACIADAGGWQHDTLTEDLDLSYRAQMKGWKFAFLPDLVAPAELPPDMDAFKQQQYRWAKGGAQTARKLLPAILKSRLPKRIKFEAFFHLTSCVVYPCMLLVTFMLYPVVYLKVHLFNEGLERYLFDFSVLMVATCSAGTFYVCSQRVLFKTWADSLKYIPFLMSLGIGIALNNSRAVLAGFFARGGEFVRTPKFGVVAGATGQKGPVQDRHRRRWRVRSQPFLEFAIGIYLLSCVVMCFVGEAWHDTDWAQLSKGSGGTATREHRLTIGVPFLCLFMAGYFYVSLTTWFGHLMGRTTKDATDHLLVPAAAETPGPLHANGSARDGTSAVTTVRKESVASSLRSQETTSK